MLVIDWIIQFLCDDVICNLSRAGLWLVENAIRGKSKYSTQHNLKQRNLIVHKSYAVKNEFLNGNMEIAIHRNTKSLLHFLFRFSRFSTAHNIIWKVDINEYH